MLGVVISKKQGSKWEEIPSPNSLIDALKHLEECQEQQIILVIETFDIKIYVSGTDGLKQQMAKHHTTALHATYKEAYDLINYMPLTLLNCCRAFLNPFPTEEAQKLAIENMKKEFGVHKMNGTKI